MYRRSSLLPSRFPSSLALSVAAPAQAGSTPPDPNDTKRTFLDSQVGRNLPAGPRDPPRLDHVLALPCAIESPWDGAGWWGFRR